MSENDLTPVLRKLKRLNFAHAYATFWIIKRHGTSVAPTFQAFYVATEPKLQKKLADIVRSAVERANRARAYDYFTADMEDQDALVVNIAETDFDVIQAQIDKGVDAPTITKPEELNDSWAYLIDVEIGGKHVRAVHKIAGGWALKKQSLIVKVLFAKSTLMDYEEAPVFQLVRTLDFIAFEDTVFVLDKSKFESALNFRKGMERKRDELLNEFGTMGLFSDVNLIRERIGTNLRHLRRAASVKKNGYYRDGGFIAELKTVCNKYGWNIAWQDGKIVVTAENEEVILTVLNNDRLESPVNHELFDVTVKDKVK
jgi:hypothetical protein